MRPLRWIVRWLTFATDASLEQAHQKQAVPILSHFPEYTHLIPHNTPFFDGLAPL